MNKRTAHGFRLAVALIVLAAPGVLSAQSVLAVELTPEEDRALSEFNHHLAGVFLVLIGACASLSRVFPKLSLLGKVWPFLFILPGLYLAFLSDPNVWPMGSQSWLEAFMKDPETTQHKIYASLLIALGILEFRRSRGKLGKFLATWSFPLLAVFGAILLFFHPHGGGGDMDMAQRGMVMPGGGPHEGHMAGAMAKIKTEHLFFSIVGFGVAVSKFVSDGHFWKRAFVPYLWPALISVLGLLLLLYTE